MLPGNPSETDIAVSKSASYFRLLGYLLLGANACRKLGNPTPPKNSTYQSILVLLPTLENDESASLKLWDLIANDKDMTQAQLGDVEEKLLAIYDKLLNISKPLNIPTDDELRNINSFEYLHQVARFIPTSLRTQDGFAVVWNLCQPTSKYDYHEPYGNHYTKFLLALEKHILYVWDLILKARANGRTQEEAGHTTYLFSLDHLVNAVYMNHNFALERAYMMISEPIQLVRQTDHSSATAAAQERLQSRNGAKKRGKGENVDSPMVKGSAISLFSSTMAAEFKPMTTTSQPSLVNFAYKSKNDAQQIRFGTQGQVVNNTAHVNPIFRHWLDYKRRALIAGADRITHVYFNNLTRIGGEAVFIDMKRKSREDDISRQLETIESTNGHVAIITFPAYGGFLQTHASTNRALTIASEDIFNEILAIANGTSKDIYARDFYISAAMRKKLFETPDKQNNILHVLLNNSFVKLGFKLTKHKPLSFSEQMLSEPLLSLADQQAIYFHFIKYELTNYILATLKPDTFNFSCKDAIDRGGISSAYYNLIKSINLGKPLSKNEFECILHGAPIIVKGRTMNAQIKIVWNVIDAYLEANKTDKNIPAWLPIWRNQHAPADTPYYYVANLENYITLHKKKPPSPPSSAPSAPSVKTLFSKGLGPMKAELAERVLRQLTKALDTKDNIRTHPFTCRLVVTESELKYLHDKHLGALVKKLENDGLLKFETSNDIELKSKPPS